jgi:hypothetical protein
LRANTSDGFNTHSQADPRARIRSGRPGGRPPPSPARGPACPPNVAGAPGGTNRSRKLAAPLAGPGAGVSPQTRFARGGTKQVISSRGARQPLNARASTTVVPTRNHFPSCDTGRHHRHPTKWQPRQSGGAGGSPPRTIKQSGCRGVAPHPPRSGLVMRHRVGPRLNLTRQPRQSGGAGGSPPRTIKQSGCRGVAPHPPRSGLVMRHRVGPRLNLTRQPRQSGGAGGSPPRTIITAPWGARPSWSR